ncbi:MAG: ethanolamine ammonia-lyase subunit EutC [Oscillospiraceae bacterium]|jgi:ethanolamine ammonia-lyase small subunit
MLHENDVRQMVEKVLAEMLQSQSGALASGAANCAGASDCATTLEDGYIDDITVQDLKEQFYVPNPVDLEGYMQMKQYTPARLGVWRAGPRYNTITSLRFRADHATAQDSVFSDVSEEFIKANQFVEGITSCANKDEYITRPDLGRILSPETAELFKKELKAGAKVQIMVGDGLSSAAIEANIPDVIPAILQGLRKHGIETGPIAFVKYCRVGAMDQVGELTGADVVCCLIGERPGLVTAESMSAYIAYKPTVNMPEARRTVVSNIHKGGTPPAEAGAHIADLLKTILDKKVSGIDLKL